MLIAPIPLPPGPTQLTGTHPTGELPSRPRVVVLGGGFAGLAAVRGLARTEAEVVLVDRHSAQTLQPLLPAVAAGRLPRSAAAVPFASLVGGQRNARLVRGEVRGVDKARRTVRVGDRDLPYDFLVVATGARARADAGAEPMLALETAADAVAIRGRIRSALERAQRTEDAGERQRLTTFVVVGAGPTGVALAAAVAGAVRQALASEFRGLDPETAKIVLVEAAIRVLPAMAKGLSGIARRALQDMGVELKLGVTVSCCPDGVVLAGKHLPSATVLWAGGVAASPVAAWLDAASDEAGRVVVEPDLSLPGYPEIVVIGDAGRIANDAQPLPGLAMVAKHQGEYAARMIAAQLGEAPAPAPFRCRPPRMLAPIGRGFAIGRFGPLQVWGRLGWLAWAAVHLPSLIGTRRVLAVMFGRFAGSAMPTALRERLRAGMDAYTPVRPPAMQPARAVIAPQRRAR